MKKSLTACLLAIFMLLIGCKTKSNQEETPKQEETIDLGIKKTDVMKAEEVQGGTKVSVSKTEIDFAAIKEKNKDVEFVQEGNRVMMRRGNNVSGTFDCTCVNPTGTNTNCKVIIFGSQISCKNDGCTGKCDMLIVISDKKISRFW